MIKYNNIINIIKIGFKYNKKKIILNNINNKEMYLIKLLINVNLIKIIKLNKNYVIFLKYYKNKPIFNNIINMSKTSHLKYVSLKNIKKINLTKDWLFILNTNKGLINNFEAEKNGVGGILILKMWN
jgi:ribosomal protein S8